LTEIECWIQPASLNNVLSIFSALNEFLYNMIYYKAELFAAFYFSSLPSSSQILIAPSSLFAKRLFTFESQALSIL
jgi:hypothetical protein